ncbi:hypothetical protein OIE62_20385 [Streptomyces scopuliridis]|uniref:Uncharacterized protein n=1 Tax=Streptomyces scopuliridis TaxID=452529 RepID=A0ACD4ZL00_9ACTN|nr:hypothetical protein [Streptomyces scopuliridis]WSB99174.1 hypothetical protein OG835_20565 [Streptomyces scopuliridis]WSC07124.1 hypothetical protein OIE62_20385 [Streptomyces scopuliridis]
MSWSRTGSATWRPTNAVSTGERVSFTMDWTVFREYLETPGLFVLLGGERAAGVAVCPSGAPRTPRTWTGSG